MTWIDRNLMPGETILFRTRKHLIIFAIPVILLILAILLSFYMATNFTMSQAAWAPGVIAFIYLCSAYLEYITSEFVVTNKRVIMREGFFYRHANELRLSTISQVNVEQGVMGQLFGFGDVHINAFGVFDVFNMISGPFQFQKSVNEQLDKIVR